MDFPILQIPPEYLSSSDSGSEGEFSPGSSPPSTPATPVSQLGASVSSFSFGRDALTTPSPKPRHRNIHPGRFRKGESKRRVLFATPSKPKRTPLPRKELLRGIKFPPPPATYPVHIKEGDVTSVKDLLIPHGSQVMDMEILSNVFQMLRCPDRDCTGTLQLHKYPLSYGLQSYYVLHCIRCHEAVARFSSSPHLNETSEQAVNNPKMFERRPSQINTRALIALHVTSLSWQDFRLTCNLLDLPIPGHNLGQKALDKLCLTVDSVVGETMNLAVKEVRQRLDMVDSNIPGALRCHVSFDASWHRRGHYSNQGFGAAIDSESGKVLDYDFCQRVCRKCLSWTDERKAANPDEYSSFISNHEDECTANFAGTSQAMEGEIAVKLWKRSVSQNRLVYSTYIGDGDSSSYKRVVASDPYIGKEQIRKEECLGHVQKRLKKHLKKGTSTSPAIAKSKVERVGQLYALVVYQNRGKTPNEIHLALYNLLDHLAEKHAHCPSHLNSWCYYGKALAERELYPEVALPIVRQPYLSAQEIARANEVFSVFAALPMCSSLTMGKTQNSNEALHSVVWHNSPKAKHVGQKSIHISTALAVSSFNEGSLSIAAVLREYGIAPSYTTLKHLAERDQIRNDKKDRAIKETVKRRRRQLKVRTTAAESSRMRREKSASKYHSGQYGTEGVLPSSSLPEEDEEDATTNCAVCDRRHCPKARGRKTDEWIGCDLCQRWFHARCVEITKVSAFRDTDYFCDDCENAYLLQKHPYLFILLCISLYLRKLYSLIFECLDH